jgi:hypothetical protein
VEYFYASFLSGFGEGNEFPDRRGRHLLPAVTD